MLMSDMQETRIQLSSVTSYAPDRNINHTSSSVVSTIRVTIGSVLLVLTYTSKELRDKDLATLDSYDLFKNG